MNLNIEEYRKKVQGCWMGKNIGGTLGTPLEGKRETNNITFYVHDLDGTPLPNDDLDLQLIWLQAAERHGVYNITPRLLGEYWINYVSGPWNEYSVCRFNVANGFYPPLSGSCNNEDWKSSNGAWIRSEVWACLFPGNPDEAIRLAYMDSCADHYGDGIYAEMFTAALQSAAFIVSDINELIKIGLTKIPADCRVARSVKLVCECYEKGEDWLVARNKVVEDSADLGWFQAPANVAFSVLGLLYGEGDFGKSICRAVNCGDDTDCTAATVGAILGIIYGIDGIPQKWIDPIGKSIKNIAIHTFGWPRAASLPDTIDKLAERTIKQAITTWNTNHDLISLTDAPTDIPESTLAALSNQEVAREIWAYSPYELTFQLPYADIGVTFTDSPLVKPGQTTEIILKVRNYNGCENEVNFEWHLPESWNAEPACSAVMTKAFWETAFTHKITVGEFSSLMEYIQLDVRLANRANPTTLRIPFQLKGSVNYPKTSVAPGLGRELLRVKSTLR